MVTLRLGKATGLKFHEHSIPKIRPQEGISDVDREGDVS